MVKRLIPRFWSVMAHELIQSDGISKGVNSGYEKSHMERPLDENVHVGSFRRVSELSTFRRDDEGSISLLVIGLFLVVLTLSMAIVDIAGSIVVKMDLTHAGEAAISSAAHSLDLQRYYLSDRIFVRDSPQGPLYRVPVDCGAARIKFEREIASERIKGEQILVLSWQCAMDALEAQIGVNVPPLVPVPFLPNTLGGGTGKSSIEDGRYRIVATVKAESLVAG